MSLEGKTAVVTGASGNLGTAVTARLIHEGARVAAVCYSEEGVGALQQELAADADVLPIVCDVTHEAEVASMMDQCHNELGGPEALLNLVGGYDAGSAVVDLKESSWDKMMTLNLKSAFICSKHALRYMLPADCGRIVSVSSKVAVDMPGKSAAYAVSKAGVVTFTRCLAQEVKGTGVSVAAVMPSLIDTPVTRAARPNADTSKWVTPEQVAAVLACLVSDRGGLVNGAIIPIFGGV